MKDKLMQRLAKLEQRLADITAKVEASKDENEVTLLTARAEELKADMEEIRGDIAELEKAENEQRDANPVPANAQLVDPINKGTFSTNKEDRSMIHPTMTLEYREAFRDYMVNGTPIPAELRAATSTTDTGVAIPMTIMNEVINTVKKQYGILYRKVKKVAVKGGVKYPIGALSATFKWISETTVSPREKLSLGSVVFGLNVAELRIATTFLANLVTIEAFEAKVSEVIAEAYVKAMDEGILNGSGDGAMLGILNDARVTNTITMTAAKMADWKEWYKSFFAKLPVAYRGGEFIFPVSTVDTYLATLSDANNAPVFKPADFMMDGAVGRFYGREVTGIDAGIIKDFDTASAGDVVGIYWQPDEYAINENFGFNVRRYFDEETNEWVDKALTVVDGKVLNPTGYYKIIKG